MPLVEIPEGATPEREAKVRNSRAKLLGKAMDKYCFRFEPLCMPDGLLVEDDQLVGLRFRRTQMIDGRPKPTDETFERRGSCVISSIGSIPLPIEGVPMKGELFDFTDWDLGRLNGFPTVFATGNVATESQIRAMLDTGIIVVVDEAYYEFCGQTALPLLQEYPNLVVLRTFSKWAGLAGLRVGLGVMDPSIAQTIMSMKPPYNVNLAAEIALIASLGDLPTLTQRINCIVAERDRMLGLLREVPGIKPWPSQANFVLCHLPEGRGQEIFEGMCRRGIFPRYFNNSILKDYMRISVGLPEETDQVIAALSDLVRG